MGKNYYSSKKSSSGKARGGNRYFVNKRLYDGPRRKTSDFKTKKFNKKTLFPVILILIPVLFLLGFLILHTPQATLIIEASEGGTVLQPGVGSFEINRGEVATLAVEPEEGWKFKGWEGDARGSEDTLELEMKEDRGVRAVFEPIEYSFQYGVDGQGELHVSPQRETYRHGERLFLEVQAKEGWQFKGWQGDATGEEPETTLVVDRDLEVSALFSPLEYTVALDVERGGEIEISPERDTHSHGETITVRASEKPGFRFSHWSGGLSGKENPVEVLVEGNIEARAVFERLPSLSSGDSGDKVRYLQEQLAGLGFYPDQPDGNFGLQTNLAVKKAQIFFDITVDGVVGPETWSALESERGTFLYTVQRGDTLWGLAQRWNTTVSHIRDINNLSNPDLLRPGDVLWVPGVGEGLGVKDLHWEEVQRLLPREGEAIITDVETGLSFRIYRMGGTYHADVEPLTAQDTAVLRRIYGGDWNWERRAVIVAIGKKLIAGSINGYPHGDQTITDNHFAGHICLHFRGSRLHVNHTTDPQHQAEIDKAAESTWPADGR